MPQGRRSRLVIRRVDPWTILKFSGLLYFSMYFVLLVAGIVLWLAATASGVRGNIESFIGELIASDNFQFKSGQVLRASVFGGAILVVVGSLANVLMAVLFNLISDIAGGIGISVEERQPRVRRRRAPRQRDRGREQGQGDRNRGPGRSRSRSQLGRQLSERLGKRAPGGKQAGDGEVKSSLGR